MRHLAEMMAPEPKESANKPRGRGIGAQFNKYFGDLPDDGTDYSQYFKAIDEAADDGVFIAPDGTVHDLKAGDVENVDIIVGRGGFSAELFGAEIDPSLPRLVDDTDNPLASGIDPEVLLAMDDEDVDELDDDFVAKALDLENEPLDDGEEEEKNDGKAKKRKIVAKSRVSEAPSHMSRISHRSAAMDIVEERVEYLLNTVYNEEEQEEEEEEDDAEVDWEAVKADFKKFAEPPALAMAHIGVGPSEQSPAMPQTEEEEHEEEEEGAEQPREKAWDCQSQIDTLSTTENRPGQVRDGSGKGRHKPKEGKVAEKAEHTKIPAEMMPQPGESREEAKIRKAAIKAYQRQRRASKKAMKERFTKVTTKVKKSIAASGGARGQRVVRLD
jgi:hypothetical protein